MECGVQCKNVAICGLSRLTSSCNPPSVKCYCWHAPWRGLLPAGWRSIAADPISQKRAGKKSTPRSPNDLGCLPTQMMRVLPQHRHTRRHGPNLSRDIDAVLELVRVLLALWYAGPAQNLFGASHHHHNTSASLFQRTPSSACKLAVHVEADQTDFKRTLSVLHCQTTNSVEAPTKKRKIARQVVAKAAGADPTVAQALCFSSTLIKVSPVGASLFLFVVFYPRVYFSCFASQFKEVWMESSNIRQIGHVVFRSARFVQ